jgi:hypothetical protein
MTEYRKIDLYKLISRAGKVDVTIVNGESGAISEETFTEYETAVNEIEILENENTVYF